MGATAIVLGASGFSGAEIVRLLLGHGAIEVVGLGAHARAGAAVTEVLPHVGEAAGLEVESIEDVVGLDADVCFSCLVSGALADVLGSIRAPVVIDLADDFRGSKGWTYGLTEFMRAEVADATRIANPGCYPTAILLSVLPFARAGLMEGTVIVDALSGVSGAGRRAEQRLLFAELSGGASAYGTVEHRHVPEVERGLAELGGAPLQVSFTPHLVPMSRGVLVTARADLASQVNDDEVLEVLRAAYKDEPFIEVVADWPKTKPVTGTNRAHVSARVDTRNGLLICSAAIDNLGKGAAGQAIQNANVALGIEESAGLGAYGVWP
ncbi:MAG: N-acetyl-gamma-glutamyl-phosphate reductase [Actinomycetota bacterium]